VAAPEEAVGRRPPVPFSMRIVSDAAAGLHAAHELRTTDGELLNVVHRDVSPDNILVTEGSVKVTGTALFFYTDFSRGRRDETVAPLGMGGTF